MRKFRLVAASLPLALLAAIPVRATEKPSQISGIYADLRRSNETDDLGGTEIFIIGRYQKFFVFYQFWEGGSLPPVVVPVDIHGNEVSFSVPAPSGECGSYRGIISARGFDGICIAPHGDDPAKEIPIHLKRTKRYWQ